jgi:hypothetical protein
VKEAERIAREDLAAGRIRASDLVKGDVVRGLKGQPATVQRVYHHLHGEADKFHVMVEGEGEYVVPPSYRFDLATAP